ncbi:flagellar biosynthesis repressor FlbT [Brevirhabdus sp.]|uniref:flagellar biosynthesis repressor FlbT n=1 Tax=Brevirhabdus sp. TaxID=2004514 RepID=UPI0040588633
MALNLTLKPFERIVVNGCMMRNGGRKSSITVETRADIIRETDILRPYEDASPVSTAYFLIQSALIQPEHHDDLRKAAQVQLAALVGVFAPPHSQIVFETANLVSTDQLFQALRCLRPLIRRERELLGIETPGPSWLSAPEAPEAPAPSSSPATPMAATERRRA